MTSKGDLRDKPLEHDQKAELCDLLGNDLSNVENNANNIGKIPLQTPESCLIKKVNTTNASVSFCIPDSNTVPHHRYSISSKPISPINGEIRQANDIIENNNNIAINNDDLQDTDDELQEKDCTVHMPGDFFYFNPEQDILNTLNNESLSPSNSSTNNYHNNNTSTNNSSRKSSNGNIANKLNFVDNKFSNSVNNIQLTNKLTTTGVHTTEESNKLVFKKTELDYDNIIPFTKYFQTEDDKKLHILLGATGSVATIKIPLIIDKLFKIYPMDKISIQLIVTKPAEHFLNGLKINRNVKIWREEDCISANYSFNGNNETLLYHELSRWADIFLIAPLSANSLAKLANGICNNLLTSVIRDWSVSKTPILVAPAMNTFMYINPMTRRHLNMLKENFPFLEILKPVEKVLICGDIGMGGMREWVDIVEQLRLRLKEILRSRNENEMDNEDKELATENEEIDEDDEDEDENEDDNEEEEEEEEEEEDDDEQDEEIEEDEEEDKQNSKHQQAQNDKDIVNPQVHIDHTPAVVRSSANDVFDSSKPISILQH